MDEKTYDDDRDGRPKNYRKGKVRIEEALNEDRIKTIDELADHFDVSHRTVYCIITNELKMTKVSARQVPRLLSDETSQCEFKRRNVFSNATEFLGEKGKRYFEKNVKNVKNCFDNECKRKRQMYRNAMGDYYKSQTAVNRDRVFSSKTDYKYYCRKMKCDYDHSRCKLVNELRRKKPR